MALKGLQGTRLDQIWNTTDRRSGFRVCIWNPRLDDIQSVATNKWNGPRYDMSVFVSQCSVIQNQVFENNSNSISSRATIKVVIDEKEGILVGGRRLKVSQRMFRDGTPIVIYEGDRRVAREDWPPVFTGVIRGTPGAETATRKGKTRNIQVQAFGRAQIYQNQEIVGMNWPYDTDFGDMAVDIAMMELDLGREEILFGTFGKKTKHIANALAQINKMKGLYEIMRTVDRKPYFDSRGLLVSHDISFDKPPVMFFDHKSIISMVRSQYANQYNNSVQVTGLDHNLVEIASPESKINEVSVTMGFWDSGYSKRIYYSEDHTRRARNTRISSQDYGFGGGGAGWSEIDEFHGRLTLSSGYAPWLVGFLVTGYVAAEFFSATVESALAIMNASAAELLDVINVASQFAIWLYNTLAEATLILILFVSRLAATAALLTALTIMTRGTRWEVAIHGQLFENVYQEIRSIAVLDGLKTSELKELEENIHWLSTIDDCKARSKKMLSRELVKPHAYEIKLPSNPLLEVDDILELTAPDYGFEEPSRFYVTEISRVYKRPDKGEMTIKAIFCGKDLP